MVQKLAEDLLTQARSQLVQDIYFVPKETNYQLYFRMGEERVLVGEHDLDQAQALIGHFKFKAGMNVGEKRRDQLGSCDYELAGHSLSLRLSSVGDYRGQESLVIRLLHDETRELRFWFDDLDQLAGKCLRRGLYLFSGPVGSGKTTLMHELAKRRFAGRQIMSIEDPVEIKQADMLQLQLNEAIGLTYDSLIKLSLRHRPDLLIIGEIRDAETARAVIRASLTGVTVFSTIHARSVPGVYERLLELGLERQELDNGLQGICYQRLLAGGGLVDFVKSDFESHSAIGWNAQVDQLVAAGYLTEEAGQAEKIGSC